MDNPARISTIFYALLTIVRTKILTSFEKFAIKSRGSVVPGFPRFQKFRKLQIDIPKSPAYYREEEETVFHAAEVQFSGAINPERDYMFSFGKIIFGLKNLYNLSEKLKMTTIFGYTQTASRRRLPKIILPERYDKERGYQRFLRREIAEFLLAHPRKMELVI